MKKTIVLFVAGLLGLSLSAFAGGACCGAKVAEKASEKASCTKCCKCETCKCEKCKCCKCDKCGCEEKKADK
jgi:hypothetical protein